MSAEFTMLWNLILSVVGGAALFMLNRVSVRLDTLAKQDTELAEKISDLKAEFVPKAEFVAYSDRLERRLEQYMNLQMESNKTIFAKLDLLSEKVGEKISRQECIQMMGDRRLEQRQ